MPATTESLLHQQLREAMRRPHEAVNRHPLLAPLHRPGVTRLGYGNALCAMYGMVAAVEQTIWQFLVREPDWCDYPPFHKRAALESDLAVLGRAPVTSRVHWPAVGNAGNLFGLLYVLEGATLGGDRVARQVRAGGTHDLPTAYFDIYDGQARSRWDRFLRRAGGVCPREQYPDAVATTTLLFSALALHLDAVQPQLPMLERRPLNAPRWPRSSDERRRPVSAR